jgi:Domain of unknown function (DUF4386)
MEQAVAEQVRAVRQARVAGLCYLLVIAGGLFAEVFVRGTLIEPGDAAATVRSIAAHEALWRWGLAVHLLYLVAAIVMNVLICGLLRAVEPTLARLALVLSIASVTVEASSLLQLYLPLAMLEEGSALTTLGGAQRQALSYLAIRMFPIGFGFSLLFFAGFCVLVGALILRSRLVPRLIGLLMVLAGACYAANTLALVLSPALSERLLPAILLPPFVGELSLALWLLVKGLKEPAQPARLPQPAG